MYLVLRDNKILIKGLLKIMPVSGVKKQRFKRLKIFSQRFINPKTIKRFAPKEKYEIKIKDSGNALKYEEIIALKAFICIIFGTYSILILSTAFIGNKENIFLTLLLIIIGFLVAFRLPDIWLKIKTDKRIREIQKGIIYFVDMLAISLEAGMNLESAMDYISKNMKGELTKNIRLTLEKIKYGLTSEEILDDLYANIPAEEFRSFISSIKRAKKLGVSLSGTLNAQSELIRIKKAQKAEEISRTSSVKISIPLTLFIFPALLIIYIGPAILRIME